MEQEFIERQNCPAFYRELKSLRESVAQLEFEISQDQKDCNDWLSLIEEKDSEIRNLSDEREALVAIVCKQQKEVRHLLNQLARAEEKSRKLLWELSQLKKRADQSDVP